MFNKLAEQIMLLFLAVSMIIGLVIGFILGAWIF
jgi:hypothetical protein